MEKHSERIQARSARTGVSARKQGKPAVEMNLYRTGIFIFCLLVFAVCAFFLESHYDPLARYPYGNPDQRRIIENKLSDSEIDYLINSQMDPEVFMQFIETDGFQIRNSYYYRAAIQIRPADPEIVVDFVNSIRSRWSLGEMENYLRYYSYSDLTDYLDSRQKAELVLQPDDPNLVLKDEKTVWTYSPANLRMDETGLILLSEAMDAWSAMQQAAAEDGVSLTAHCGYVSYMMQKQMTDSENWLTGRRPAYGSREEQLGTTLVLEPALTWASMIREPETEATASESDLIEAAWLEQNCDRFGFIIRYPASKDEQTGYSYQPFVLRYVGVEQAQIMKSQNLTLEEYISAGSADQNLNIENLLEGQ